MTWKKSGEDIAQEVDYGAVLPSRDGTYEMWVSVDLDPQSKDIYSCHVEHYGLQMVLEVPQESGSILLVPVSGTIILTIVLAGVGVLTWRRRSPEQREVVYHPTGQCVQFSLFRAVISALRHPHVCCRRFQPYS